MSVPSPTLAEVRQTIFTTPDQPDFGPGNVGNCVQAAIASLLGRSIEDVPHFADYPAEYEEAYPRTGGNNDGDPLTDTHGPLWWGHARRWAREQGWDWGWEDDIGEFDRRGQYGLVVLSLSFVGRSWGHFIVGDSRGEALWNPHPLGTAAVVDGLASGSMVVDGALYPCDIWEPGPPVETWLQGVERAAS